MGECYALRMLTTPHEGGLLRIPDTVDKLSALSDAVRAKGLFSPDSRLEESLKFLVSAHVLDKFLIMRQSESELHAECPVTLSLLLMGATPEFSEFAVSQTFKKYHVWMVDSFCGQHICPFCIPMVQINDPKPFIRHAHPKP